jgi:hypothetical protein
LNSSILAGCISVIFPEASEPCLYSVLLSKRLRILPFLSELLPNVHAMAGEQNRTRMRQSGMYEIFNQAEEAGRRRLSLDVEAALPLSIE